MCCENPAPFLVDAQEKATVRSLPSLFPLQRAFGLRQPRASRKVILSFLVNVGCVCVSQVLSTSHQVFRGYAEQEALIELRDFRVIRGSLPGRAMALVLEWASEHRDELMENWNLCSQLKTARAIEPLK